MLKRIFFISLILLVVPSISYPQIPPEYEKIHGYMPVSYLENYPIQNTNKKLIKGERARLGYRIVVSELSKPSDGIFCVL